MLSQAWSILWSTSTNDKLKSSSGLLYVQMDFLDLGSIYIYCWVKIYDNKLRHFQIFKGNLLNERADKYYIPRQCFSCFVLLRYTSMMKISKSSLSCATQKRFCFGNTWIDLVCWYMYTSDIYFLYSLSWNLMIFFLHINLTGNIKKIYF